MGATGHGCCSANPAECDRRSKKAEFTATYDGEPQFKPIEGTDMSYAVNSPNDIIVVGGKHYAGSGAIFSGVITCLARGTDFA